MGKAASMARAIGEAVEETGRPVVLLASGGMSHRFWPMPVIAQHEASDPVHVRTPEARAADEAWMQAGDHRRIIEAMDDYARFALGGLAVSPVGAAA